MVLTDRKDISNIRFYDIFRTNVSTGGMLSCTTTYPQITFYVTRGMSHSREADAVWREFSNACERE
jgi:hypothetical protein